jgi:hypothetical protein
MTPSPRDPEHGRDTCRSDAEFAHPARCAVSPYEQHRECKHECGKPRKRRQLRQTVNQAVACEKSQGNRTHCASVRVNKSIAAGERD